MPKELNDTFRGREKFHANGSQCIRNSKLGEQQEEETSEEWGDNVRLESDDMRLKSDVRGPRTGRIRKEFTPINLQAANFRMVFGIFWLFWLILIWDSELFHRYA